MKSILIMFFLIIVSLPTSYAQCDSKTLRIINNTNEQFFETTYNDNSNPTSKQSLSTVIESFSQSFFIIDYNSHTFNMILQSSIFTDNQIDINFILINDIEHCDIQIHVDSLKYYVQLVQFNQTRTLTINPKEHNL